MRLPLMLVLLFSLLGFTPEVGATSYRVVDGYRIYDGYGGYWYGNDVYNRQYYTANGYYAYGYYYPPRQTYRYVYSHTYSPTYSSTTTSYGGGDWKNRLLVIAQKRDEAEAKIRQGVLDQMYFLQGVQALGLQGNFNWQNYGTFPNVGSLYAGGYNYSGAYHSPNVNLSPAGVNNNTVYGYSYNNVATAYGPVDMNVLYQQMFRMAEQVQKGSAQVTGDVSGLVGQAGDAQARVAEILARGAEAQARAQAVAVMWKAMEAQGVKIQTQGQSFKVEPVKPEPVPPPAVDPKPLPEPAKGVKLPPLGPEGKKYLAVWEKSFATRCIGCHGGTPTKVSKTGTEGGLDLRDYPTLSADDRVLVLARMLTGDAKKRMPRNPDGSLGSQVPPDELKAWSVVTP